MGFFNTFAPRSANPHLLLALLLCLGLAACGTKPKNLKSDEPFPKGYPQPEAVATQPAVPPPATTVLPTAPAAN